MPRTRSATSRLGLSEDGRVLVQTAERMVDQIESLVHEIAALRAENDTLRGELRGAVSMLERASAALDGAGTRRRRRREAIDANGQTATLTGRAGRGRLGRRGKRGRATPDGVTPMVIRAAIGKLGPSTAAEIAAEISRLGSPVSGRAVRFLAERAGAQVTVGEDGLRRYQL